MAKPIPYDSRVRPIDTEKALRTLQATLFPNETRPWAVDFRGTCPRCGDPIDVRQWLVVVSGVVRMSDEQLESLARHLDEQGVVRSHGDETFDLRCACDAPHPGRPKDERGCGAQFRVNVTWP